MTDNNIVLPTQQAEEISTGKYSQSKGSDLKYVVIESQQKALQPQEERFRDLVSTSKQSQIPNGRQAFSGAEYRYRAALCASKVQEKYNVRQREFDCTSVLKNQEDSYRLQKRITFDRTLRADHL